MNMRVRESLLPYYVPSYSRLPFLATIAMFCMVIGGATALNHLKAGSTQTFGPWLLIGGLGLLSLTLFRWFSYAIRENLLEQHSPLMKNSYVLGMIWFIFSEVMFFFGFFFALFYVRVFAGPWLGEAGSNTNALLWPGFEFQWPLMQTPQEAVGGVASQYPANTGEFAAPQKSMSFPGWQNLTHWLPLWNTAALLSSSFTVHLAHLGLKAGRRKQLNFWLAVTVLLGVLFLALQYLEYHEAYAEYGLTLRAGAYGATFFILTGFHGFHVCLGAFILLVMWLRATASGHFSPEDHFGFEAASWYWHFVDVVWVCLFLFVYIL